MRQLGCIEVDSSSKSNVEVTETWTSNIARSRVVMRAVMVVRAVIVR